MLINPNETIHLVALIEDTTDTNTYYVRVVMRDSATGKILGQVNLTRDAGNTRRFTGNLSAPSMTGPAGRYIDTTTTVYTDSGYTTVSGYPEILERYIVAVRWSMNLGSGGSGDPFAVGEASAYLRNLEKAILDVAKKVDRVKPDAAQTTVVTKPAEVDVQKIAKHLATVVTDIMAEQESGGVPADLVDQISARMREDLPDPNQLAMAIGHLTLLTDTSLKQLAFLTDAAMADKMSGQEAPGSSQNPVGDIAARRTQNPTPSEMTLQEVFKRHMARTGQGGQQLPPAGTAPNTPAVTGPRAPSPHVIPKHVIARNKEALSKLPA